MNLSTITDPEMRLAARTRERPIVRQQVKILTEKRGCTLPELYLDTQQNPHQYGASIRKQTRLMFYQRRLRELREQQRSIDDFPG